MIRYVPPSDWIRYDYKEIADSLSAAKAVITALAIIPYQSSWAERLQAVQLRREVAGTSKIEGADFAEGELEAALSKETPEEQFTRSQRQARAAKGTYDWIASIPNDRPIGLELIQEIHRRIVTGADDDHCEPGKIRGQGDNVTFGVPTHRGAEGGAECAEVVASLIESLGTSFKGHDTLIQSLALHYHLAAIHPFADGNGRTARAMEALMLRRAGLKNLLFIAMSNYYNDEKQRYLQTLSHTRSEGHDLTSFLVFGLRGIKIQCERLLGEIRVELKKALFRDVMYQLANRLRNQRLRVIAFRQIKILHYLLDVEKADIQEIRTRTSAEYASLAKPTDALVRDLQGLLHLKALELEKDGEKVFLQVNLDWPTQITETTSFKTAIQLPKAKSSFVPSW